MTQSDDSCERKALTPAVTVKVGPASLKAGTDYTVGYKDNVNVGIAMVTATSRGNYAGSKSATFKIAKAAAETVTMWRLCNPWSGEHLYTASDREKRDLVKLGWNDEGVGWVAPKKSNTPLYRMYNPYSGDHHYTPDAREKDAMVRAGWSYEGVGWYSDDAKGTPLYREFNPYATIGTHNYTTSKKEHDSLGRIGWKLEGVAWYGVKR